jgi:hypothetical protein
MPVIDNNDISASGLTVNSQSDIVNNLSLAFRGIYGSSININPNSPDGELIAVLAQAISDQLQLLLQINATFSIDSAYGTLLDQRVAMSGITRNQGTYTEAFVLVTVSAALTLPGQDVLVANPGASVFTVSDTAGNQYQLASSYTFASAGSQSLMFNAVTLGPIQTTPNTITTVVTVTPGVTSVNNPSTSSDIQGLAEETDPALKIRQAASYMLQAVGPSDAIRAAILNIPAADCYVAENDTSSTNLGVPGHGVWIVVNAGGATAAQIGQAIYAKKGIGAAMTGAQSYVVTRPAGNTFTAQWDNALQEALYIQATLYPQIPGQTFDTTAAGIALAAALSFKLGQSVVAGNIVTAMASILPLANLGNVQIATSGSGPFQQILTPSTFQYFFVATAATISLSNA